MLSSAKLRYICSKFRTQIRFLSYLNNRSNLMYKNGRDPASTIPPDVEFLVTRTNYKFYQRFFHSSLCKQKDATNEIEENDKYSHLFSPLPLQAESSDDNYGEELVGPISKDQMQVILGKFFKDPTLKDVIRSKNIDDSIYQQAFISFRKYCIESKNLPTELHIKFSEIINNTTHFHDLLPYFMEHAKRVFPHLTCIEELCKISDLRQPPNWYPEAREMQRKIIFHAGPTNSGKTYHAMERFLSAKSGVYCGPLKLLAVENFNKSNERGTPCDLVTGEERRFGIDSKNPSNHVSCTAEMASINIKYDVGVIDEIQLLRDPQRGWAWTRAFLGLCAKELHVCGEFAAIPLIEKLAETMGEKIEIRRYKRLTQLTVQDKGLQSLNNAEPGDCYVCFNKKDLHFISASLEKLGHQVAVIYGSLPPGTKLAQAKKFNDPSHPCKMMVATDAIGMGLNLSIRRIIFCSVMKVNMTDDGKKEMDIISVSQALQIGGRAGRYGTQYEHGYVTTLNDEDLPKLKELMESKPDVIEMAGLHPTPEQIELFAYHIPNYTLSNLIDIFINVSTVDKSQYFICTMGDFKFLADMIQHIPLPLRSRYVFCCSPINKKMQYVCVNFLKFARMMSQGIPASANWLCNEIQWPIPPPNTLADLVHLECVFDVCDLYLWLSYRFPDMYPDQDEVREVQQQLDTLIEDGVSRITSLMKNSSSPSVQPAQIFSTPASSLPHGIIEQEDEESGRTIFTCVICNIVCNSQLQLDQHVEGKGHNDKLTVMQRTKGSQSSSIQVTTDKSTNFDSSQLKLPQKIGGGKLANHLIAQGLLSPNMLEQLQKEWQMTQNSGDSKPVESSKTKKPLSKGKNRRRKHR